MHYKVSKSRGARTHGSGFFIDGFGYVTIKWVEPENFDKNYDELNVYKCGRKAMKNLLKTVDSND